MDPVHKKAEVSITIQDGGVTAGHRTPSVSEPTEQRCLDNKAKCPPDWYRLGECTGMSHHGQVQLLLAKLFKKCFRS